MDAVKRYFKFGDLPPYWENLVQFLKDNDQVRELNYSVHNDDLLKLKKGWEKDGSTSRLKNMGASLLKLYLMELPKPLIPKKWWKRDPVMFNKESNDEDFMRKMLRRLPESEYRLLKEVIRMLHEEWLKHSRGSDLLPYYMARCLTHLDERKCEDLNAGVIIEGYVKHYPLIFAAR